MKVGFLRHAIDVTGADKEVVVRSKGGKEWLIWEIRELPDEVLLSIVEKDEGDLGGNPWPARWRKLYDLMKGEMDPLLRGIPQEWIDATNPPEVVEE